MGMHDRIPSNNVANFQKQIGEIRKKGDYSETIIMEKNTHYNYDADNECTSHD